MGVVSLPLFVGLDESRDKMRDALAAELPLNFRESVEKRLEMARLLSAWEASKLNLEVQEKNRIQSRMGTQQRVFQPTEQHAMRVAVEAILGRQVTWEKRCLWCQKSGSRHFSFLANNVSFVSCASSPCLLVSLLDPPPSQT